MEALLSLYRHTLAEDIKDSLVQANAHTLQRKLYETSDVFGQLYKYDNFHKAFCVPPNPCEKVSFLRFWRGVEDTIVAGDCMFDGSISFELQKALFIDGEHLRSMRLFRDEILCQESPIPISTFLSIIDRCNASDGNCGFWSRVRENSRQIFANNDIHTDEVSNMVLGYLSQRVYKVKASPMELRTMSTCISLDDENGLTRSNSNLSVLSLPTSRRGLSSTEYRYRMLLEELDVCLPTLYDRFCDRIDELNARNERLERELEYIDIEFHELKSEYSATKNSLRARCETLEECNMQLHHKLESKKMELENYQIQVANLKRQMDGVDTSEHDDELQSYMKRCIALEQANMHLQNSLQQLERRLQCINNNMYIRSDACVGADEAYIDVPVAIGESHDTWASSQERENLVKELDKSKSENATMSKTILDMNRRLASLSQDLADAQHLHLTIEAKFKDSIPRDQFTGETEKLNGIISTMEAEIHSLRGSVTTLQDDYRALEADRDAVLSANSGLERAIAVMKADLLSAEVELCTLRKQCMTHGSDTPIQSELQRRRIECPSCDVKLQAQLDAMENDNIDLLTQIESFAAPPHAPTDTGNLTDAEDTECYASSLGTDTTKGDHEEHPSSGLSVDNLIKINPALAETRRLNTLNAVKYGHIDMSQASMGTASALVHDPRIMVANSGDFDIPRSLRVNEEGTTASIIQYPNELPVDSSETVSPSMDGDTDVFQDAAAYFAERFNLGGGMSG